MDGWRGRRRKIDMASCRAMKVCVLGGGTSGLFAAYAASKYTNDIVILSKKINKPIISGFQFLHQDCDLSISCEDLIVTIDGSPEDYSKKVYGEIIDTSAPTETKKLIAYNMEEAIDILWDRFRGYIKEETIYANNLASLSSDYDLVFSTIPLPALDKCGNYASVKISVIGKHLGSGRIGNDRNWCMYISNPLSLVVRTGVVFGRGFTELLYSDCVCGKTLIKVIPTKTLPVFPSNFYPVGRYGSWSKDKVDDVYHKVGATCQMF